MEAYNILNTIKPNYMTTKFPYNLVNPAKVIFTRKKISIMVKKLKKGGGENKPTIIFYG